MQLNTRDFGITKNGDKVKIIDISNDGDLKISVINWGATLQSVQMKDRNGNFGECTFGFDNITDYETKSPFYGSTVGRVGNRIANGLFTIDGTKYQLPQNNGTNCLHGGLVGFDKVMWDFETFEEGTSAGVIFSYLSKDGEEGFPGNLKVKVQYTLTSDNELILDYRAETDKKTIVNLTNHAYWNLCGDLNNISGHNLQIEADSYLPTDSRQIPTGELKKVDGTPFNFKTLTNLGKALDASGGFDHNFNLSLTQEAEPVNRAYAEDPVSGRSMEILTTEPGIQLYVPPTRSSFCLEAQKYPDAVNQPNFDSVLLAPGDEYRQITIHNFVIKHD